MRAANILLYMDLITRLAALTRPAKDFSMTDTDTATAAPAPTPDPAQDTTQDPGRAPVEQPQTGAPTDAAAPTDPAQTSIAPADTSTVPKCTATASAEGSETASSEIAFTPASPSAAPSAVSSLSEDSSPFIQTAMAAAKLIEQLRQHPESHAFLQALLKCLEPPQSKSSND